MGKIEFYQSFLLKEDSISQNERERLKKAGKVLKDALVAKRYEIVDWKEDSDGIPTSFMLGGKYPKMKSFDFQELSEALGLIVNQINKQDMIYLVHI